MMHINYVQIGPLYTSRGPLLAKHLFRMTSIFGMLQNADCGGNTVKFQLRQN